MGSGSGSGALAAAECGMHAKALAVLRDHRMSLRYGVCVEERIDVSR